MNEILDNKMTTVIHQPYFLPWLGYFAKLVYADKFIVLDNVYFSKRKFIDRVKIINAQGKEMWVGLPVGENFNKPCNKIQFSDKNAINKIIKSFYASYSKARHFKNNIAQIENILNNCFDNSNLLSEINMNIIKKIMQLLDLKMPEIILSSQFKEINDATERVIMLCKETKCNVLISGAEGLEKHDLKKLENNGISVSLQDYFGEHPTYFQTRRTQLGFAKGLSVVDCIFNEGVEKTKQFIADVKYKPIQIKEYQ
ncbi:MAG: WbqC family protein [Bacteroidales bacterium]|jgi:hypothetical protein|nr:WbqC family protein [Bacteroidales bacterium]